MYINESSAFSPSLIYIIYIDLARAKSEAVDNIQSVSKQNIKSCNAKGDVTRDNSQRRFLAQHSDGNAGQR